MKSGRKKGEQSTVKRQWRKSRYEGEIWHMCSTSSAHLLLYEKSEAGEQLKMDDFFYRSPEEQTRLIKLYYQLQWP
jgi:hypothetical protein